MGNFFAPPMTADQLMKRSNELLSKAALNVQLQRQLLEREDANLLMECKAYAKQGRKDMALLKGKALSRKRATCKKLLNTEIQLHGIKDSILQMSSVQDMTKALRDASHAMMLTNAQINMPALREIIKTFEQEASKFEDKAEQIDSVMEEGDMDEDELLKQVMDEIGIEISEEFKMPDKQTGAAQQKVKQ